MSLTQDLIERIRALFAAGAAPGVAPLEQLRASLEQSLAAAQQESADAQQAQASQSLTIVAAPDGPDAVRARDRIELAARQIRELTSALDQVSNRLLVAKEAQQAAEQQQGWKAAETALAARQKQIGKVQDLLVKLAAEHLALLETTEAAWAALPVKPANRPPGFKEGVVSTQLQVFLFGASNGRLGSGCGLSSAYMASQRPDLKAQAAEAAAILLSARASAESGEATHG